MSKYDQALEIIEANGREAITRLNKHGLPPNVEIPVTDGKIFWNVIAESDRGWEVEQHKMTQQMRLVNPKSIRMAWGDASAFSKAISLLLEDYASYSGSSNSEQYGSTGSSGMTKAEAAETLLRLKQLLDCGAITESEYEMKKAEIMPYL